MRRLNPVWIGIFAALLCWQPSPARAQLAAQPIVSATPALVGFVQDPVFLDTFYLVLQQGSIMVLRNGVVQPTPFLDVTGELNPVEGEGGLLGMAFAPATPERVFVYFSTPAGNIVVARFTRQASNPFVAAAGTRKNLVWSGGLPHIPHPGAFNHFGGQLAFGPDGYLYLGPGDGGGGNDTFRNAQNPGTLLGKILRIDINVPDNDPKGFRVPPDNPFVGFPQARPEIWDFGLRNPWRFSFDNVRLGGTGALIIGDVGQSDREEINFEPRGSGGRNYGWPLREGKIANPNAPDVQPVPIPFTDPIHDYPRGIGVTVVGGFVYRGSALPAAFRGRYFFGDFGTGRMFSIGPALDRVDHTAQIGGGSITSIGEDASGELYIVRGNGTVHKVVSAAIPLPPPPAGFTHTVAGTTVHFSWQPPAGPAPTAYQLEVGSATGQSNVLVTRLAGNLTSLLVPNAPDGRFFVRLRGVNGSGIGPASVERDVRIGCASAPPVPAFFNHAVGGGRVVTLQWGASAGATGYVLEVGSVSGGTDVAVAPLGPATGLVVNAPPGTFFVQVRARNSCGTSAPRPAATPVVVP
jgi:glucose/arabinose dehydrogenase